MVDKTKRIVSLSSLLLVVLLASVTLAGPGLVAGGGARDISAYASGPRSPAAATPEGRWLWQNPLPQGNELISVFFVDANTGWAVGLGAAILRYVGYRYSAALPLVLKGHAAGW